jgi:hypothetical protein
MGSTPEAYRVYNKVSPLGLDGAFLEISTSTLKESAFDFKIENTLEDDNQIKKESEEESEKEKIDALSA